MSTITVLNVIWNSSANLLSLPPDKRHDLDAVYWSGWVRRDIELRSQLKKSELLQMYSALLLRAPAKANDDDDDEDTAGGSDL